MSFLKWVGSFICHFDHTDGPEAIGEEYGYIKVQIEFHVDMVYVLCCNMIQSLLLNPFDRFHESDCKTTP
jgi:hypothetical protein